MMWQARGVCNSTPLVQLRSEIMMKKFMSRYALAKTGRVKTGLAQVGWGVWALGAIAAGNVLSACSTMAQNSGAQNSGAQNSEPAAGTVVADKPMDHSSMGDMKHGDMKHGNMKSGAMMEHGGMDLGPADAEFDQRFLDGMGPHHEGAVVMAKAVLQKSKRPELKKLATAIIRAQAKEIAQMQAWRVAWYPQAPSTPMAWHAQMGHMMAMSAAQRSAMRMDMDLGSADAAFDQRFLAAMIPHHEGAVVMANDVLKKSKRPELLQFAKAMIASQQAEINQMQQWQKIWSKP